MHWFLHSMTFGPIFESTDEQLVVKNMYSYKHTNFGLK